MLPCERLDAYLAGKKTDRRPNLTIVGSVVTRYNGINVEEYCKDWRRMTEAAVLCARDLQLDFVQIASDLLREAEGYGAEPAWKTDALPNVARYPFAELSDAAGLAPKRAREIPRLFDLVSATEYARELCPEIYPMTLCVGPVTVASNLRGMEPLLMDFYDDPDAVRALLATLTKTTLDLLRELAAAGARYFYVADPVASLFSPAVYENMILPLHRRVFAEGERLGMIGRLHMCGNTTALLPYTTNCGARVVDIDCAVDYPAALRAAEGRCLLNGNLNPAGEMCTGTPAEIRAHVRALATACGDARCLFMPGCELPRNAPRENLLALHEALCAIG